MAIDSDKAFDTKIKARYFRVKYWFSWFSILVLGILAYTPAIIRDFIANMLASVFARFNNSFKRRVLTNFAFAYPNLSKKEVENLYRKFIRVGAKLILAYGETFFKSKKAIANNYLVQGLENLQYAQKLGKPIIFMAPHTWTIDRGGLYLSAIGLKMCTMMHTSKNEVYDWFMNSMRLKFGGKVFERSSGIKSIIKALKSGYSCFFLPDQDLATGNSVFVDFFASKKSTLTVLPKLARLGDATVVPIFCCYNEKQHKFEVVFGDVFENYPSGDLISDVRMMNESIENLITTREEQYMWFLKIYKTRPHDEKADTPKYS